MLFAQVNLALEKDPSNAEFASLKDELVNLITLTKDFLAQSTSKHTNSLGGTGDDKALSSTDPSSTPVSKNSAQQPKANHQKPKPFGQSGSNVPDKPLNTGDSCMAKYAGDGKYYPAKITTLVRQHKCLLYVAMLMDSQTDMPLESVDRRIRGSTRLSSKVMIPLNSSRHPKLDL